MTLSFEIHEAVTSALIFVVRPARRADLSSLSRDLLNSLREYRELATTEWWRVSAVAPLILELDAIQWSADGAASPSVPAELTDIAGRAPWPTSVTDEFSAGLQAGLTAVRRYLLNHASSPDDDHRQMHVTSELGLSMCPGATTATRSWSRRSTPDQLPFLQESDLDLSEPTERRAALLDAVLRGLAGPLRGTYLSGQPDPLPDQQAAEFLVDTVEPHIPSARTLVRARRAANPDEDALDAALQRLADRTGVDVIELHRRYFVRRLLEKNADALIPVRASFGRSFEAGYDAAGTWAVKRLRARAAEIGPETFTSRFRELENP